MAQNYQPTFGNPSTKEIVQSLQKEYNKDIEISTYDDMPNQIFIKTKVPQLLHSPNYDNKIHIQCKNEKKWLVLKRIFEYVVPYFKKSNVPLLFKLLNVPLILINGWEPFPLIPSDKIKINDHTIEQLIRSNWRTFTPNELSSVNLSYDSDNRTTYTLNGEEYNFETLFVPNFVFYTESVEYTKFLLTFLKQVFSDEYSTINDSTYPDYYPRFNIKINNMIYVSYGDSSSKKKEIICGDKNHHYTCTSKMSLPDEYKDILQSCRSKRLQKTCEQLNELPKRVSNHRLCEWKDSSCHSRNIFSPALLGNGKKTSIRDLYTQLDQQDFLERDGHQRNLSQDQWNVLLSKYFKEYLSSQTPEQRKQRDLSLEKERQEIELKKSRIAGIKKPLKKEDFPKSGYEPKNGNVAESFSF